MSEVWWIDAFTTRPFAGNPAAVVFLDEWPANDWMAGVAREMNLSETAFLAPGPEPTRWRLRWFTPAAEVELCGHATLASARALLASGRVQPGSRVTFRTASGDLRARVTEEEVEMDFPATPPVAAPPSDGLLSALGLEPGELRWSGRSRYDCLVEVADAAVVARLEPDFRRLVGVDTRGVIVTAAGEGRVDFVSRFFAPAVGVDEDPVTGSAHCALAPFWCERLGRRALWGRQISERGGEVRVRVDGDRVGLAGATTLVARGSLLVPPG